jgi:hypothetical protein
MERVREIFDLKTYLRAPKQEIKYFFLKKFDYLIRGVF